MERRRAEVWSPFCRGWQAIEFRGIQKGMIFRLFEDIRAKEGANTLVKDADGNSVYVAVSNAYIDENICKEADCHIIKADPIVNWDWEDESNEVRNQCK